MGGGGGGLSPAEGPDGVSGGACCRCRCRRCFCCCCCFPPFFSLLCLFPRHRRVHKVLRELRDTDESRGRGARGSMGASAPGGERKKRGRGGGGVKSEGDERTAGRWGRPSVSKCSLFLFRSEPVQDADAADRSSFTMSGQIDWRLSGKRAHSGSPFILISSHRV